MPNKLPKHEFQARSRGPARRRRRRWAAAGTAGLAGAVGLMATALAGPVDLTGAGNATGLARLTSLRLTMPDYGSEDEDGPESRDGPPSEEDREGGDREGGGAVAETEVPCAADHLIIAINQANAGAGGILDLAERCSYILTAHQDGNGLPVVTQPITIRGNDATISRAANAAPFRILNVGAGGDLKIRDLTITGGLAAGGHGGGGIWVQRGGRAIIEHSIITRNASSTTGGGVAGDGSATIRHSTITDNSAQLLGGGIINNGLLAVEDSKLAYNNSAYDGGGLHHDGGKTLVTKSTIDHNRAGRQGAGISAGKPGPVTVTYTKISDNSAVLDGGGIAVRARVDLTLRHVNLDRNAAGGNGGGLAGADAQASIADSLITDNTAGGKGAGVYDLSSDILLRNSGITGNLAVGARSQSGGLHNDRGRIALLGSRIVDNISTIAPGGIFSTRAKVTVDGHSVIVGNRSTNCQGSPLVPSNCFG